MPIQVEVFVNCDQMTFVCTQSRPLSLPIVRTWTNKNSLIRVFDCLMDSAGIVWTNGSRGGNDDLDVYRRVTWRETLNLIVNAYPGILGEVIAAVSEIHPHLMMMEQYAEFKNNEVVKGFLEATDVKA